MRSAGIPQIYNPGFVIVFMSMVLFFTSCSNRVEEQETSQSAERFTAAEEYPKYVEYRLTAEILDFETIDSYPQKIKRIISDSTPSVVEITVFAPYRDMIERWKTSELSKAISDYDYLPEIAEYLITTDLIESDSEAIDDLNTIIAFGEEDFLKVIDAALKFTAKNIDYDPELFESIRRGESRSKSALWTLRNQTGSSAECTNLFIAICRNRGIPSRFVVGTLYDASFPELYQMWAEVYLPGIGWYPVDPTAGTMNFTDIAIRLFIGKDYEDCGVNFKNYHIALKKITEDYP